MVGDLLDYENLLIGIPYEAVFQGADKKDFFKPSEEDGDIKVDVELSGSGRLYYYAEVPILAWVWTDEKKGKREFIWKYTPRPFEGNLPKPILENTYQMY